MGISSNSKLTKQQPKKPDVKFNWGRAMNTDQNPRLSSEEEPRGDEIIFLSSNIGDAEEEMAIPSNNQWKAKPFPQSINHNAPSAKVTPTFSANPFPWTIIPIPKPSTFTVI